CASPAAAVPMVAKMPAPMMAPTPSAIRFTGPSALLSWWPSSWVSPISSSRDFVWNICCQGIVGRIIGEPAAEREALQCRFHGRPYVLVVMRQDATEEQIRGVMRAIDARGFKG